MDRQASQGTAHVPTSISMACAGSVPQKGHGLSLAQVAVSGMGVSVPGARRLPARGKPERDGARGTRRHRSITSQYGASGTGNPLWETELWIPAIGVAGSKAAAP